MGNSLSEEELNERTQIINTITRLNLANFDLRDRNGLSEPYNYFIRGLTGYIDFIKPDELPETIDLMKGVDSCFRNFFVFKARFLFADGTYFDTFSTFFQRYSDNNLLWHCCGHYGIYLMNTEGGTNNSQFKLIEELFTKKNIQLNKEKCLDCRLNFTSTNYIIDDEIPDTKFPIQLKLLFS
jgi:hypothetical protein